MYENMFLYNIFVTDVQVISRPGYLSFLLWKHLELINNQNSHSHQNNLKQNY